MCHVKQHFVMRVKSQQQVKKVQNGQATLPTTTTSASTSLKCALWVLALALASWQICNSSNSKCVSDETAVNCFSYMFTGTETLGPVECLAVLAVSYLVCKLFSLLDKHTAELCCPSLLLVSSFCLKCPGVQISI